MPVLADIPRLDRRLELAARRVVEGLHAGRHRSPSLGPSCEFADHRPYLPGDDLRSVDWKVAARRDRLMVRRQHEERDLPLCLLLDTSASMDWGTPSKRAWAELAVAALAVHALLQGDRVRLGAGAAGEVRWFDQLAGPAGPGEACRRLESLAWGGAGDPAALLAAAGARLRRRALVVLVSDLLCEPAGLAPALGALAARGHEVAVLHILHPDEVALPADWGLCRLDDPEGREPARLVDTAAAKAGYDAAMDAHRGACAAACAGAGADRCEAPCQLDQAAVLGRWLHRRARG